MSNDTAPVIWLSLGLNSMSNATTEPVASTAVQAGLPTIGWALRRAILGLTIMLVGVAAAACLLYFAIDADSEARADTAGAAQAPGSFLYNLKRPAQ